jgi:hypothetical protein
MPGGGIERIREVPFGVDRAKAAESVLELIAAASRIAGQLRERSERPREGQLAAITELGGEKLEVRAASPRIVEPTALEEKHDEPTEALRRKPVVELSVCHGPTLGEKQLRVVVFSLLIANQPETNRDIGQVELERLAKYGGLLEQQLGMRQVLLQLCQTSARARDGSRFGFWVGVARSLFRQHDALLRAPRVTSFFVQLGEQRPTLRNFSASRRKRPRLSRFHECFVEGRAFRIQTHHVPELGKATYKVGAELDEARAREHMNLDELPSVTAHPRRPLSAHVDADATDGARIEEELELLVGDEIWCELDEGRVPELASIGARQFDHDNALRRSADFDGAVNAFHKLGIA